MSETPINHEIVLQKIKENKLNNVGTATIREIKKLVDTIEKASGEKFIRMEMGVPGLPPSQVGVEAEIAALKNGVAAIYPDIFGIPTLKSEISLFVKNFLNIDVLPECCLPTVGSMQGSYASFITLNRIHKGRNKTLFMDPGFPVHKQQMKVIGLQWESFDVYNYRGDKLKDKLESYFSKGDISSVIYSNPNNPSWICLTDKELQIIGDLANKYDIIVMEDLAYFGMDFRQDFSQAGKPPYQPSVANYTENYILFISSSKVFSYAGQRIGMMIISNALYKKEFPDLLEYYVSENFGHSMIFGTVYALSSGTAHSAQYALAAILKAANSGQLNFVEEVKEYGRKAQIMKKMFIENGFKIVYDMDEEKPIADGFYFTFSYPGLSGSELLSELIFYGISAISLAITGSERIEGIRACVSLVKREQFPVLEKRLKWFNKNHSN
ncbi:MAG: aminotransferase [Bacteroidetes bacterium CG2_30_33_31]|nr:MAG: aminotransferase [Bacteroidetes bacterium CG2_30_33_31]